MDRSDSSAPLRKVLKEHYVNTPDVLPSLPFSMYVKFAKDLLEDANTHYSKNIWENSYVAYYRFCIFSTEKLPTLPAYKQKVHEKDVFRLKRETSDALKRLDYIVGLLDAAEDRRQEEALIDLFDGDNLGDGFENPPPSLQSVAASSISNPTSLFPNAADLLRQRPDSSDALQYLSGPVSIQPEDFELLTGKKSQSDPDPKTPAASTNSGLFSAFDKLRSNEKHGATQLDECHPDRSRGHTECAASRSQPQVPEFDFSISATPVTPHIQERPAPPALSVPPAPSAPPMYSLTTNQQHTFTAGRRTDDLRQLPAAHQQAMPAVASPRWVWKESTT